MIVTHRSRISQIGATVFHRAIVALSGLSATFAAGRWLAPAEFGLFAICLTAVFGVQIIHSSFVSEPMLVFGTKDYKDRLLSYIELLSRASLWGSAGFGAILSIIALYFIVSIRPSLALIVFGLAFYAATVMRYELQERALYSQLRPGAAALSGLVALITQLGLLAVILMWLSQINITTILMSMAAANISGIIVSSLLLRRIQDSGSVDVDKVIKKHVEYGRWFVIGQMLYFIVTYGNVFLIPILQDIEQLASYRAVISIVSPAVQAFSALGLIALPIMRRAENQSNFVRELFVMTLLVVMGAAILAVLLVIFGPVLLGAVYDGKYTLPGYAYSAAGIYAAFVGLTFVSGSGLRALERPKSAVGAAVFACLLGLPAQLILISQFGATGAIVSQAMSCAALAGAMYWAIFRDLKNHKWSVEL